MTNVRTLLWGIVFASFVALKVAEISTWSWWWLLMPLVPVVGYFVLGVS